MQINTETASVTLTYEIGMWFFLATHLLDMQNSCAKLFQNPSMDKRITSAAWTLTEHEWLHINIKAKSGNLNLETGVWFFLATCCLDMPNTCAKLFLNPSMHK